MADRPRKALITGITGQDGSYLAESLLADGFEVYGVCRRSSNRSFENIAHLIPQERFVIRVADLTDPISLRAVLADTKPDFVYNLAAMSFVGASWEQPVLTIEVNAVGFVNLLEAVRDICPQAHVYQASTSEMFGNSPSPQNEDTAMIPCSPYGVAKLAAHRMAHVYRESHGLWVTCGILFNHESPRRGLEFISRKIARGAVRIAMGREQVLRLGNLDARRDWGFAVDYVAGMRLMMERDEADDFVIGTGQSHSVRDLVRLAFDFVGLPEWERYCASDDPAHMRPAEVNDLVADARKARTLLGWSPTASFGYLVEMMVMAEANREGWTCNLRPTTGLGEPRSG